MYLVDTNILLAHLQGNENATKFIDDNFEKLFISFTTYFEILTLELSQDEENDIRSFISRIKQIQTSKAITDLAIGYRKTHKLKLPEAIIAASAKVHNLILVTQNKREFGGLDFEIINPVSKAK